MEYPEISAVANSAVKYPFFHSLILLFLFMKLLPLLAGHCSSRINLSQPGGYANSSALGRRLRGLFVSCLLLLSILAANAQTDWTKHYQTPNTPPADIAYGAGRYVVVGGEGGEIVRTSDDGTHWTTLSVDPNSPGLYGIVYAAGTFVMVGLKGTVRTSTDGLNWTTQVSGTDKVLFDITYGGGQFMAVGLAGTAITSTDGVTWTSRTTGTTDDFVGVIYGGGGL